MGTTKDSSPITISYWDKKYQDDFIRLNKEWIEQYFCLEASDLKILNNPEKSIILTGGEIFFALENGKVVGCCAFVHHPDSGRYELAKMAVSPSAQGKGIGFLLGSTLLSYARKKGVTHLFLEANTKLEASIKLYHKLGFHAVKAKNPVYNRCNLYMETEL